MSRDYVVIVVNTTDDDIDGVQGRVVTRFTEHPGDDYLFRLAQEQPGRKVYCLSGASTWHCFKEDF